MSQDPFELMAAGIQMAKPKVQNRLGGPVKVFQFTGQGYDPFYLEVGGGDLKIIKGTHKSPTATIQVNRENLVKLIMGQLDAMQAYFSGQLKVTGSIMDAASLVDILRSARPS